MKEATKRRGTIKKRSLAYLDDLTGIYNRRYLKKTKKEIEELQERSIPFSVVIVDIDHFKEINDTHGHLKGDEVIKEFSRFLTGTLRATDTVVRYGGDEFVCVMSNTERKDAQQIYTRILDRCKKHKFGDLSITVSAGIASYPADGGEFDELLKIADESLYDAKRSGRGKIGTIHKKRIELPTKLYIGRRKEKETLKGFLTEGNGYVRAALIEGNIGIGKTRLVREVVNTITGREILWSDCLAFFEGISYYPIREIIKYKINRQGKKIINDIPFAYKIELGKLIPEIMEEVKERIDEIGLVLDKYRLYESIRRIIELGDTKKIIIIDNMQWSDRETTEVIKYLLRSLRASPITFIFIYRQEEKTDVLEDFTSYISRETEVKKVALEPLERSGIQQMVNYIIGEKPDNELVSYIEQGSGGNPFYVEEIIKGLNEAGHLRVEGDAWHFDGLGAKIIPKSINDITERKYQGLSKEGREILEIASVIGRFDIDIIKDITGYNEGHIIGVIETIKRLGLIKERDDRIEFQEEISRGAIYKRYVSDMKGRMLHKRIGEKIEEQYQGREHKVTEELAFHFYRGMDRTKGVRYCLEAGDRAHEQYANQNAIRYYTWAEELLRNQHDIEFKRARIDCLLKRADILSFIGDNEGAMKDFEEGLKLTQAIADKKREVDIRFRKASLYVNISRYSQATEEANECIKLYEELGDKKGIALVLNAIGNTQGFLSEYNIALKNYEDALTIFREIGDKNFEARVLNNQGLIYMNLGDHNKALQHFEDSLKIKAERGDKYREGAALNNIGLIYMSFGNYKEALKIYEDALAIFREIGNKYGEALVLNNIGIIHDHWGNNNEGLKFSEDALKIANDTENRYCEALALRNIGTIHMHVGNYDRSLRYFDDSRKIAERTKSNELTFTNLESLAYLYLSMGNYHEAKEYIDKAYNQAKSLNSQRMLRDACTLLCEFYLEQKKIDKFEETIQKVHEIPETLRPKKFEGDRNLLMTRYYIEVEDLTKADKHAKKALAIFQDMGDRLSTGIVYYYMGMCELRKGTKTTPTKHLGKAAKLFTAVGAKGWRAKVNKILKKNE
jgi:diguanylate cyclase (GGDEF)-like protein